MTQVTSFLNYWTQYSIYIFIKNKPNSLASLYNYRDDFSIMSSDPKYLYFVLLRILTLLVTRGFIRGHFLWSTHLICIPCWYIYWKEEKTNSCRVEDLNHVSLTCAHIPFSPTDPIHELQRKLACFWLLWDIYWLCSSSFFSHTQISRSP